MPNAMHRNLATARSETDAQAPAIRQPRVSSAGPADSPADSPARTMQERLAEDCRLVTDPGDGRRWSPRATLALGGGVSLALWAAFFALVLNAIR